MNFYIMTLFPEMVMDGLNTSIIGRAAGKDGAVRLRHAEILRGGIPGHVPPGGLPPAGADAGRERLRRAAGGAHRPSRR